MLEQKLIIGVTHDPKKEHEELSKLKKIVSHKVSKAGLELSSSYEMEEDMGARYVLFSPLASYLKDRRIQVVPLEDPNMKEAHFVLEILKAVKEGRITEQELIDNFEHMKMIDGPFKAPEAREYNIHWITRYEKVFEMLKFEPTLNDALRLWGESNKKREDVMIDRIKEYHPEIVVVGTGHAMIIKENLPDYRFLGL